jgi:hypothetical protein
MALNPIKFATEVNDQFLNYQLTAFPLTDPDLAVQARSLLRGHVGRSPLFRGPYVSLSKSFKFGRNLNALADAGITHPALPGLAEYPTMFAHQDATLSAAMQGNHCLIATGTGSGKTEAFLYPILDHCLRLRDTGAPDGVAAILVYPMNALAIDQLGRLRRMLAGSGVSFGMYVGTTAADDSDLESLVRLKPGEGKEVYERIIRKYRQHERVIVSPSEERLTEKDMAERPPRLLLTNVNQLELLLTRGKDLGMFINAPLKFLVFDEAHTYSGAAGAEVACLIRRLRAFCGKSADDVICLATSATMTDPDTGQDAGIQFARRFFGVDSSRVVLVKEEYQSEEFPHDRYTPAEPAGDAVALLDSALHALEGQDEAEVRQVVEALTGEPLSTHGPLPEMLYEHFKANQYVYALYHHLERPCELREAVQRINLMIGRDRYAVSLQDEAEFLCYLALGAAAEKDGNSLLRPKAHYFVKGLEGAVITFVNLNEEDPFRAELHLSLTEAKQKYPIEAAACLPVLVCKNCGQHYMSGYYRNFSIENGGAVGGDAEASNVIWEPCDETQGVRVIVTNRFTSEIDDDTGAATERLDRKRIEVFFCRWCGTLHKSGSSCQAPKCKRPGDLVKLWCIPLGDSGKLSTCPSCAQKGNQIGARIIEPIKPLQAVTVADVHILAQNMVNAVPPPQQRLIVFSDNRQDAAFQAGWMQDHARRYRLRHLIYDFLHDHEGPASISDIQDHLMRVFRDDRDLAKALAPEVFIGRSQDAFGTGLEDSLRYYLRIALVREWATGFKQRDSLETWGMARVVYAGVEPTHPWITEWAEKLRLTPEELAEGIAALLDVFRRNRLFFDEFAPIFSRYWHEGDEEVQRGYLPFFDFPPKGLKEYRETNDKETYIAQLRSARGLTTTQDYASKWKINKNIQDEFLNALWAYLTETIQVLKPVSLVSNRGRALPGTGGVYQLASSQIGIIVQRERYRCSVCQRLHTRMTPSGACTARYCKGTLSRETPPEDDYNIRLLSLPFSMLSAQEHSAQVPGKVREKIEEEFKKPGGRTNCLVATPTLELGVDIGDLDIVLMRNVPPKPSNYWQRVGRAGRRHRMAVLYTYCRRSRHDSYFFDEPARMLDGLITAPRFNLRNEIMIRKHIHAAVISELIRLSRLSSNEAGLSESDIAEVNAVRNEVFPNYILNYLFIDGRQYRHEPYSVTPLRDIISKHKALLLEAVRQVFATYWPEQDREVVSDSALEQYLEQMADRLQDVVNLLHRRMLWAFATQNRLLQAQQKGLLEPDEEKMLARCRRYLKQLAEREMNTYVLRVLAVEGFLPGYGTYEGGIRAFASQAFSGLGDRPNFDLSRPPSIAIREFVPGNLIYANSGRFKVTLFHFPVGEDHIDPEQYIIDVENERIVEATARKIEDAQYGEHGSEVISGLPTSDVDITYISRISDDEENRFQLPVSILGYLKKAHRGGVAYTIGRKEIQHRFGQQTRLVNIGPADRIRRKMFGFPVCSVCGATRSPYASSAELNHFAGIHKERCGKVPESIAISADTRVDGLLFQGLEKKADAVNLGEALRIGAAQVLEMEVDDLQLLPLPQADGTYHLFVYDPMPGGSGLLQQMMEQWSTLVSSSRGLLDDCPNSCDLSCYQCMRTYRNVFYHELLERKKASKLIAEFAQPPQHAYDIPAIEDVQAVGDGSPTNRGEFTLGEYLERMGFPAFEHQRVISIGPPFGRTTPDLFHHDPASGVSLALYLDGLSRGVHGNPERARIDRMIREQLEADGIDVIEIASSDLADPEAMRRHLKRIAVKLKRHDLRDRIEAKDLEGV